MSEQVTVVAAEEPRARKARSLSRNIASQIIAGMAHRDMSFGDIDKILDWKPGSARRLVIRWSEGGDGRPSQVAEICWALDLRAQISLVKDPSP